MTNILLLLRLQFYSVFSLNRLTQERVRGKFYKSCLLVLLLALLAGYNCLTALSLVQMGQADLIPAYMIAVVSFIVFFFNLLQVHGILFNSKEVDRLLVLPLKVIEIVCGKFAFLYLLNLLLVLLFMLPAGLVWLLAGAPILDFFLYSCLVLFLPIFPLCLASLLAFLINYLATKLVHQNLFSFLASLVLLLVLLAGSIWAMRGGQEGDVYQLLARQLGQLYPPASLFLNGQSFFESSLLLAGLSLTAAGIFLKVLTAFYLKIHFLMKQSTASEKVHKRAQKSPLAALYRRELTNFLSSYLYMLNSGLGTILLMALTLGLCFMKPTVLFAGLGLGNGQDLLPLLLIGLVSISNPASVSISLEGGQLWLIETLPLSMKTILHAKMALAISLHLSALLMSLPILIWRFSLHLPQVLYVFGIPLVYSLFTAVQGIFINFHYPKWIWDSEVVVIKQSLSVILSGFVGMLAVVLPLVFHLLFGWRLFFALYLSAGLVLVLTVILYKKLMTEVYFKEVND